MLAIRSLCTAVLCAFLLTACAPWNAATRKVPKAQDTNPRVPSNSHYLESRRTEGRNYSCSFIEFDGKGGFLDFMQFETAVGTVNRLKRESPVMLVFYAHGWQNNTQSGDVLSFLTFLRKLADTDHMRGYRVHGVYLGWRGSQYLPVVAGRESAEMRTRLAQDFGDDVIDSKWHNKLPGAVMVVPKALSYFSIKERAEYHVTRVPIARAVFKLAFTLKAPGEGNKHRTFVLGHSFGALLLEQAIGQASVGLLSSEWTHTDSERWPFDLIIYLNSAAPSLYARQMKEFLEEDLKARTKRPRIVSITSKSDKATGMAHPIGNVGNRWFATDLKRRYRPYVNEKGKPVQTVSAGTYYAQTPGHNPLLVTRVIEKAEGGTLPPLQGHDAVFADNLRRNAIDRFHTWNGESLRAWRLRELTPDEKRAAAGGRLPRRFESNYWIVSADGTLIRGHGGIWTEECMEMLAAVYRMAEQLERVQKPKSESAN